MTEPYKLAFAAGSLLAKESISLAELYLDIRDWELVKSSALESNILQSRTVSTAKRLTRECCHRLKTLNEDELRMLAEGAPQEQSGILWISICRYYRLIAEFAKEVVREKFLSMSPLEGEDFDYFFNKKAEWHEELDGIQPVTQDKLKQVVFRMLREAGILTKDNTILPVFLTPHFVEVVSRTNGQDLLVFPTGADQFNTGVV